MADRSLGPHPLGFLVVFLCGIGPLFFNVQGLARLGFYAPWIIVMLSYAFVCGLKIRTFVRCLVLAMVFNLPMLLAPLLFSELSTHKAEIYFNVLRLFIVSMFSLISVALFDYNRFLYFLMQRRWISPQVGHTLLLSLNSLLQLRRQWNDLKIIARSRGLPFYKYHTLAFPLFVYAVRYSQRGAMSLASRGIQGNKSYVFNYDLQKRDLRLSLLFVVSFLGILLLSY